MSEFAIIPTTATALNLILAAIDTAQLAPTSKRMYRLAATAAATDGVDLANPVAIRTHAAHLSPAQAAHLRGAVKAWARAVEFEIGARAFELSPAFLIQAEAFLKALQNAARTQTQRGIQAHNWLTAQQVVRLMAHVNTSTVIGKRDRALLGLLLGAGLRRDEATRAEWAHVVKQGPRRVVNVTGKGNRRRVVPISAELWRILQAWRPHAPAKRILASVNKGGGVSDALSAVAISNTVNRYGRRIGVDDLQPHDLRRTYAQLGYSNGVSLYQLSKLLGHASIETTARYLNADLNLETTASDFVPLG